MEVNCRWDEVRPPGIAHDDPGRTSSSILVKAVGTRPENDESDGLSSVNGLAASTRGPILQSRRQGNSASKSPVCIAWLEGGHMRALVIDEITGIFRRGTF